MRTTEHAQYTKYVPNLMRKKERKKEEIRKNKQLLLTVTKNIENNCSTSRTYWMS